ncbi:MAG: hypothetical protein V7K48_32530 [Nostoc sp.]|uniref:hypothetical protein n=1 Tax=Nostoc sp. TaxID=1180 RepID=UPI002FF64D16
MRPLCERSETLALASHYRSRGTGLEENGIDDRLNKSNTLYQTRTRSPLRYRADDWICSAHAWTGMNQKNLKSKIGTVNAEAHA